jgi:hypothetical protein
MICELNPSTFFVTFISAKSKWLPLLQCWYDFNSKKLGFNVPFDKLEIKHIANLIQSNPITCAHYYDHHMKCFQKLCMKDDMIFGPLLDFFFVTEFQNRGSEYNHGLLWVANAPTYGLDSNKKIENFVDKYIPCDSGKLTPNFYEAQRHHHKKTCRKKNKLFIVLIFHGPL